MSRRKTEANPKRPAQGAAKPAEAGKKRRKPKARGTLATIGGLLIASALLRGLSGATEAVALQGPILSMPPFDTEQVADGETPPIDAPVRIQRVSEADIEPILKAIDAREERVRRREDALAVRLQALAVAEVEITEQLATLERAEESLKKTMALAQTAAENDLTQLTDVYASMKPREAALLFEEMAPEFAAGFLGRMRPESAAGIMAGLTPNTAYAISVLLAGRNAEAPTE